MFCHNSYFHQSFQEMDFRRTVFLSCLVKKAYKNKNKKSHTCEAGGTHLRISLWNLLMNLKNNYLLKKLLKWVNKNVRILIFTMLYFLKIIKKNT